MSDELVGTQTHEVQTKLLFADETDKLSPYNALKAQFDTYLEDRKNTKEADNNPIWLHDVCGDDWVINDSKKPYWKGQIAAKGEDYETYNEYQISIVAADEMVEEQTREIVLQFRPSVPNAKKPDGTDIQSMPDDLPYGVRVQAQSSNVELWEIVPLIQAVADKLGIRTSYFDSHKIHDWSKIVSLALYARIKREISEDKIVSPGKILDRLTGFGRARSGSRGMFKWDNEEIMGHYNAVTLDCGTWSKLMPGEKPGMRLKSYHMKNPEKSTSSETSHPKLEVQFVPDHTDSGYVDWGDREQLQQQLDETLLNVLQWSGIDTSPQNDTFVSDAYFDPLNNARDHDIELIPDSIETIKSEEQDMAIAEITQAGLSQNEQQVAQKLADGGQMHYQTLADKADVSESTVYRTLEKIDGIVEKINGKISMSDEYVRDSLDSFFASVEKIADKASNTIDCIVSGFPFDVDKDSAFGKWAQQHVASVRDLMPKDAPIQGIGGDREGWQEIVINKRVSRKEVKRILREGAVAALKTPGVSLEQFAKTDVVHTLEDGTESHYIAGNKDVYGNVKIAGVRPDKWQDSVLR